MMEKKFTLPLYIKLKYIRKFLYQEYKMTCGMDNFILENIHDYDHTLNDYYENESEKYITICIRNEIQIFI